MAVPDSKRCSSCGRTVEWRKKWARNWDEVKYCSERCRRNRPGSTDRALELSILALLDRRVAGATMCPSEAAQAVGGGEWRSLMEAARAAARRLEVAGKVDITQGGKIVDPSTAKGPIRIRRRPGERSDAPD